MSKYVNFEKCQKTPPDSNNIEHIFLSFSITMGQSIYEQNIIVCVSNSSKDTPHIFLRLFLNFIQIFTQYQNFKFLVWKNCVIKSDFFQVIYQLQYSFTSFIPYVFVHGQFSAFLFYFSTCPLNVFYCDLHIAAGAVRGVVFF
jgi:hypothetical protein